LAIINGTQIGETLVGTPRDDLINAFGGDDQVSARSGNDRVYGGPGDDRLAGEDGDDILSGEDGTDRAEGGAGNDGLSGGDGEDSLIGGLGNDVVRGGRDRDLMHGGLGSDRLFGEDGPDQIRGDYPFEGEPGNDLIDGGKGDDTLEGSGGNDLIYGGPGDDVIQPGPVGTLRAPTDNDRMYGGPGADVFAFGASSNPGVSETRIGTDVILDFETFRDAITVSAAVRDPATNVLAFQDLTFAALDSNANGVLDNGDAYVAVKPVTVDGTTALSTVIDVGAALQIPDENIVALFGVTRLTEQNILTPAVPIYGTAADETLTGSSGSELLQARGGDDQVLGLGGRDVIDGGPGDDRLFGGAGLDEVNGGTGRDHLDGGDGDDILIDDRRLESDSPFEENDPGEDRLLGGAGDDKLEAGGGTTDVMFGGDGRDLFVARHVQPPPFDFEGSLPPALDAGSVLVADFQKAIDLFRIGSLRLGGDGGGSASVAFDELDSNGNGVLDDSDAFVEVRNVTFEGASRPSTVIDIDAATGQNAVPGEDQMALFGVTDLTRANYSESDLTTTVIF
jgi:Ca2+-binding RTX toxin-like protein